MAYGVNEMIEGVAQGRSSLLKHVQGVTPEQFTWKPYPECKSIAETLDHLLWGDRAMIELLDSGAEPDYSTVPNSPPDKSQEELLSELAKSHEAVMSFLRSRYASADLDTEVSYYGMKRPLGSMLAAMPVEEGYHAGQIAFARMATDPGWDYYTAIYS